MIGLSLPRVLIAVTMAPYGKLLGPIPNLASCSPLVAMRAESSSGERRSQMYGKRSTDTTFTSLPVSSNTFVFSVTTRDGRSAWLICFCREIAFEVHFIRGDKGKGGSSIFTVLSKMSLCAWAHSVVCTAECELFTVHIQFHLRSARLTRGSDLWKTKKGF